MNPKIVIYSHFGMESCLNRIRDATDDVKVAYSWFGHKGTKKLLVKISGMKFSIQTRIQGWDTFKRNLYCEIEQGESGTKIVGSFRMHPIARGLAVLWFVGILGLESWTTRDRLVKIVSSYPPIRWDLFDWGWGPVFMIGAMVLLIRFSWWSGKKDEKYILDSLTQLLEARTDNA